MLRNKLKITISLILLTLVCGVSVFSKNIKAIENKKLKACECDYQIRDNQVKLNFKFENASIRSILSDISAKTGVTLVVDQEIKDKPLTIDIKNVPWRIALDYILKYQNLRIIVNCPVLRIAKIKKVKDFGGCDFSVENADGQSLKTEFVKISGSNIGLYNTITDDKSIKIIVNEKGEVITRFDGPSNLEKLLSKMLLNNPAFKTDETAKYLIVTETENRLKLLKEFIDTLNYLPKERRMCGLTAVRLRFSKEYQEKLEEENKIVTERIQTQNIFSVMLSDSNSNSQKNWVDSQEELARIILKDLSINAKMFDSGVEITTTNRKMRFVKAIIALFDKQILEEE